MPAGKSVSKRKRGGIPPEVRAIAEKLIARYAEQRSRGRTVEVSIRGAVNDLFEGGLGIRPINEELPKREPYVKVRKVKRPPPSMGGGLDDLDLDDPNISVEEYARRLAEWRRRFETIKK